MDSFHLERIDKVRAFPERSFHSLVTLCHLAAWGLGLEPTAENLAYEETICRSKHRPNFFFFKFIYITNFVFFIIGQATMKENKEKAITSGTEGEKDV